MNTTFWAINAAKKKRVELVPGTSRWVANELYLINSDVLTCTENDFQEVAEGVDQINQFIQKALDAQHDEESCKTFLQYLDEKAARNNTPANFSYISPVKINMTDGFGHNKPQPQSSPIRRRIGNDSNKKLTLNPKTPSPLKTILAVRRTEIESEQQSEHFTGKEDHKDIVDSNADENNLAPSLDDSFQAISTAIRKSIAGKSAPDQHSITEASGIHNSIMGSEAKARDSNNIHDELINTTVASERNSKTIMSTKSENHDNTRKSEYKTPKRSSIFVSLPSREPIPISSSTKPRQSMRQSKYSGPKSNSLRVFERLDIASRRDNSAITANADARHSNSSDKVTETGNKSSGINFNKTSISNQKETRKQQKNTLEFSSTSETRDTPAKSLQISYNQHKADNLPANTNTNDSNSINLTNMDKEAEERYNIDILNIPRKDPSISRINSISSVLRRARNALQNTGNKNELNQERIPTKDMLSKVSLNELSYDKIPPLSSESSPFRVRSRSPRSIQLNERKVNRSPIRDSKLSNERKNTIRGTESDLINRLMTPTGSSAAKSSRIVNKASNNIQPKIPDTQKKNRFLTTTLNYDNANLNGNKGQNLKSLHALSKNQTSPIKKSGTASEEYETRIPLKLETLSIPNLKKKSLMAERSEAAAQKPKQKLVIAVNHKYELKGKSKLDTPLREKVNDISDNSTYKLEEKSKGGEDQSPVNLASNEKRLKSTHLSTDNQYQNNEHLNKRRKTFKDKTYSSKYTNTDRKPTQAPTYDNSNTERIKNTGLPTNFKTPTRNIRESSNYLPDIESDDDDHSNKEKRILKSWANTPQLHKLVMQNRSINPVSIFGEVPKLDINEVFESQVSRHRGEQSPLQWSPKDKRRKKEERDYAIKMGYIK